jgi:hypothetical protein
MKSIVALIILATALILGLSCGGCNEPIANTLSYRCDLSGTGIDASRQFGSNFGYRLAVNANLECIDETPVTGIRSKDSVYIMEMRSKLDNGLKVTIFCGETANMFYVDIQGDVETPEAKLVAQKAMTLFSSTVPGKELSPFVLRHGWLGP